MSLLLLLSGCRREAVDFNNHVSVTQAKIGKAAEAFGRTLAPLIQEGEPVAAVELEEAHAQLLREFEAIRADVKDRAWPSTVAGADELRRAHEAFLSFQEKLLQEDLSRVLRILRDGSLSPEALRRRLLSELQALKEKEREQLAALHEAQRRFAEANGLRLGE